MHQRRWIGLRSRRRVVVAVLATTAVMAVAGAAHKSVRPAATVTDPSGQAQPTGNLRDFTQVFRSDFSRDAAPGSFLSTYPTWGAYPNNYRDTCGNGTYEPANLSVAAGVLHLNLRPGHGNAPYPLPSTGWDRLYGRYDVRFQADRVANYHAAWLLWPRSEVWPGDGEIDYPEADLDATISAFMHRQNGGSGGDQDAYGTGTTFGDGAWHTATTIWKPNDLTFVLDGTVVGHSTSRVPNTPMHWLLQTETSCTAPTQAADVRVAWATVYDYTPGSAPSSTPAPTPVAIPPATPTPPPPPTATPTPQPSPTPTPVPSERIDDSATGSTANRIAYSDWATRTDPADYGGSDHYSYFRGAIATIQWTGTRLSIQGWKARNFGIGAIATDGGPAADADWYSPSYPHQQTIYTTADLQSGQHTTTVVVTGTHDPLSPGTMINIDSFSVTDAVVTVTVTRVDDAAPGPVSYSGWGYETDAGDYGGGDHYSYTRGGVATIHWTGTQLAIQGWKAPNFGIGTIVTDSGAAFGADWYDPGYPRQQTIYTTPLLQQGFHTTTITVSGDHDAESPGTMITLDSFTVTSSA